jgi:hypothetical protein
MFEEVLGSMKNSTSQADFEVHRYNSTYPFKKTDCRLLFETMHPNFTFH